jgi:hypothetical protein
MGGRGGRRAWSASALVALAILAALAGCGGDDGGGRDDAGGSAPAEPDPQPAFYMTAPDASALERRAHAAGIRFAKDQGPGRAVLVMDFGAARVRKGEHGAALRGGTFFTNAQIAAALEAAARGYAQARRQGTATLVYANSNAFIGRPGRGYRSFDADLAREAGEEQAKTVAGLDLPKYVSATVGGDVEPGYDPVAGPEVSIALVAGANAVSDAPYYNVGTAPCAGKRCVGGWTVEDLCEVAARPGVEVLPEIYFTGKIDQPSEWADVRRTCGIDTFAGVSASPAGQLSPHQSWRALHRSTGAKVDPVIVVFPG